MAHSTQHMAHTSCGSLLPKLHRRTRSGTLRKIHPLLLLAPHSYYSTTRVRCSLALLSPCPPPPHPTPFSACVSSSLPTCNSRLPNLSLLLQIPALWYCTADYPVLSRPLPEERPLGIDRLCLSSQTKDQPLDSQVEAPVLNGLFRSSARPDCGARLSHANLFCFIKGGCSEKQQQMPLVQPHTPPSPFGCCVLPSLAGGVCWAERWFSP